MSKSVSFVLQAFVAIKIIINCSEVNPYFKMLSNWSRLKKNQTSVQSMSVQTIVVLREARIQILTCFNRFSFLFLRFFNPKVRITNVFRGTTGPPYVFYIENGREYRIRHAKDFYPNILGVVVQGSESKKLHLICY